MSSKVALFIFSFVLAFITNAQEVVFSDTEVSGPRISFEKTAHNFGDIESGDRVEYTFEFENTGTKDLLISDVKTTCGCTVPQWPKEAVAPGTKEKIKVVFNSRGKIGVQHKVITIVSNAVNNPSRLKIISNVNKKG